MGWRLAALDDASPPPAKAKLAPRVGRDKFLLIAIGVATSALGLVVGVVSALGSRGTPEDVVAGLCLLALGVVAIGLGVRAERSKESVPNECGAHGRARTAAVIDANVSDVTRPTIEEGPT